LTIDHDGTEVSGNSVTITLKNIAYTSTLLAELIANGNLALSPTSIVSNITTTAALTTNNDNHLITDFTNYRVALDGNDFTCVNLTAGWGWGNAVFGSCCDKITQIGGGVISYQQTSKVNNICIGIHPYVAHSKVVNNFTCVNLTAGWGWGNAGSFSNQGFKGNGALTFTAAANDYHY
jgi:hypothetical protein